VKKKQNHAPPQRMPVIEFDKVVRSQSWQKYVVEASRVVAGGT
jgi:hypothetical protein